MPHVVTVLGSASSHSRSANLLERVELPLAQRSIESVRVEIRKLAPDALLGGDVAHPQIAEAIAAIESADGVVVATPLYKASYSGLLKVFLDLLPRDALRCKPVLPLATGGSLAHLLAVDYALNPVLASLGAEHIIGGVFATEADMRQLAGTFELSPSVATRLSEAVDGLAQIIEDKQDLRALRCRPPSVHVSKEPSTNACAA
ncbi:NADPH-dependent FMN reductase [Trinickia violacea]|uniref:NADPH-dependent FMN reductase n=1 Tax=Trinickia violacea TaxID=2571746 RepID=A0A4P8J0R0_9BURK|nr:NADPH-dependent FMN reductase [Trinickia violacea]QCP54521.1 NADPH-dependent FMN reductase [Trinickia violacea]